MKHADSSHASDPWTSTDDATLVARALLGHRHAFEQLMRHYNAPLYRAARAVVRDDAEAEDVLQEAYLLAFRKLETFRGDARLSTWLTRIVVNEALGRLRRRRRNVVELFDDRVAGGPADAEHAETADEAASPERAAIRGQLRRLLERKIDALPVVFRAAFILREVEELTIDEAAACLGVPAATVRTRVFRARALLRTSISEEIDLATADVFEFGGRRCDRIVAGVLGRLLDPTEDARTA